MPYFHVTWRENLPSIQRPSLGGASPIGAISRTQQPASASQSSRNAFMLLSARSTSAAATSLLDQPAACARLELVHGGGSLRLTAY
jgi:hypothetical protein